ncbi:MAG TPA: hypothetical protein VHJ20_23840 [Polyangia bacterium]|nr:hypothetical protein [Polyangia bacterium]
MKRLAALLAAVVAAAVAPAVAQAYVRSRTSDHLNVKFWVDGCIPVTLYVNHFNEPPHGGMNLSYDAVVKSVVAAAHAWSPDLVTCPSGSASAQPYLEIVTSVAAPDAKPPAAIDDHKNSIIFRTDSWTKSGDPSARAYDSGALAVTTVTSLQSGSIEDADIEVNADSSLWQWANLDPGVTVTGNNQADLDTFDIQTALTHEFGHLLGLEHTCFNATANDGSIRPSDQNNKPVPDCANAPSTVEQTVMFWQVGNQDVSKRVLSADEVQFMCDVYSASRDPGVCRADTPNGCAAAPSPARRGRLGRGLGAVVVGGLVLVAARRRLRARGRARA